MKIKQKLSVMWPILLYYFLGYNIGMTALSFLAWWVAKAKGGNWPFGLSGTIIVGLIGGTMFFVDRAYNMLKK